MFGLSCEHRTSSWRACQVATGVAVTTRQPDHRHVNGRRDRPTKSKWLLPRGLVDDINAPAHKDRAVWVVSVALALASGRDGRGCDHTLRAIARLVPNMLYLRFGRCGTILVVVERVGRLVAQPG